MNILLVFSCSVLVLSGGSAQENNPNKTNKIEWFFYERCRQNSPNAAIYDRLKVSLEQFSSYLSYTANLLPKGQQQFCHDERPTLITSMKSITNDAVPCMRREEKYLPKFVADSFTEFLNFICSDGNMDSFFSTHGKECRQALKESNEANQVEGCFSDLFPKKDDYLTKDDLCRNIKSAKRCFGMSLTRSCPHFPAFVNLNNKFFDAVGKPCNSVLLLNVGSMFLVIIAFASTKLFS